jgi:hypothetical protein
MRRKRFAGSSPKGFPSSGGAGFSGFYPVSPSFSFENRKFLLTIGAECIKLVLGREFARPKPKTKIMFTLWIKPVKVVLCVNPYAPTFDAYDEIYTPDRNIAAGVCRVLNKIYMDGVSYNPNH